MLIRYLAVPNILGCQMNKLDYFKYALQNKLLDNSDWYFVVLGLGIGKNPYITQGGGKYFITTMDGSVELTGIPEGKPIFNVDDKITITKDDLPTVSDSVDTTIGIAMVNYARVYIPFNGKLPYINKMITNAMIEKEYIEPRLSDTEDTPDTITIDEFLSFANTGLMLENLSRLVTVSGTETNTIQPDGAIKLKKDTIAEFDKKYGKDWRKDYSRIAEFEARFDKLDDEHLKDDPSNNIVISGKVKHQARRKQHFAIGATTGLDKNAKPLLITNSLNDGLPKDTEQIARLFNEVRSGLYDKGTETQKGGEAGKLFTRAVSSYSISVDDCKTKVGLDYTLTKQNHGKFIGYYTLDGVELTPKNINGYIGKTVSIRVLLACKAKGSTVCKKCAGKDLGIYEKGLVIAVTDAANTLLVSALKANHGSSLKVIDINLEDMVELV